MTSSSARSVYISGDRKGGKKKSRARQKEECFFDQEAWQTNEKRFAPDSRKCPRDASESTKRLERFQTQIVWERKKANLKGKKDCRELVCDYDVSDI